MNSQSDYILLVQIVTLIIVVLAIIGCIHIILRNSLSWLYAILPLFFLVNLGAFLTARILTKVGYVTLVPDFIQEVGFINAWAVGVQFHAALTILAAVAIVLLNGRLRRLTNG